MSCSAVGCTNRPSVESSLQFFRFPLGDQDKDRLRQWVVNVKRQDWTPTKSSRLCSLHFEDHAFNIDIHGKSRLKSTAVPTVFFPPEHLKKPAKQRLVVSSNAAPKEGQDQVMEEFSHPGSLKENDKSVNSYTTCQADPQQTVSSLDASATLGARASLPGGEIACEDASQMSMQSTVPRDSNVPLTTFEDVSEIAREMGSADVILPDEETVSAQITRAGVDPGIPVAAQTKRDAPCSGTRTLLDVPSPMETQEDAQDEMEVNTIKVEDDHLERTNAEREVEEDIKKNEDREEDMKGMPVISSVIEGSIDSLSFCSLDMGVDMIEETDQEEKKCEDGDKRRMMRDNCSHSVTSIVNTGSTGKDCTGSQENGLKLRPGKQNEKVKVKDEPVDEEYDQALVSNSTPGQVKDEPDTAEDNLIISSVFSVGGASLPSVTTAGPVLVPTPPKTTLIQWPSAPPLIPLSMYLTCSACKKIILKGQTVYQKKVSSELFCSTPCLTAHTLLAKPTDKRTCHYCFKEVPCTKETIMVPVDSVGPLKDFCNSTCLSTFKFKRNSAVIGSTQTDATHAPHVPPPLPPSKILKNKAVFCKPMVQNKGVTCKPQMVNSESQTDEKFPKVIVLPVPVPVFVPVPMNLYTQYTPQPLGLPIPVPVPMFLPVTLGKAECIVETILEIKEEISSNPFEPAPSRILSNPPLATLRLPTTVDIDVGQPESPATPPVLGIESDLFLLNSERIGGENLGSGMQMKAQQLLDFLQNIDEMESDGEQCDVLEGDDEREDVSDSNIESDSGSDSDSEFECTEDSFEEVARDGTVWVEQTVDNPQGRVPEGNILKETPGPTCYAKENIRSPLSSLLCLIDTEIWQKIRKHTDAEADRNTAEKFKLTDDELKAFVGLVYVRGLTGGRSINVDDYWSADLGNPFFKETMSRQRFRDIMRYLRFDDKNTRAARLVTDKFAMISEVFDKFVENSIASFRPGENITVDDQLFPTKARCRFTQYMANKPDKFGIKFWVAADAETKYVLNAHPYLGKDDSRPAGQWLADNIVTRLVEPFLGQGRNVTTEHFFTSLALAKNLLANNTTIVGAINKKRQDMPPSVKAKSERFSTKVLRAEGITLTIYQANQKKNACILSTRHRTVSTGDGAKKLPNTVSYYNSTKVGVDVMDQMARMYSVKGGSHRWPVAVFYNILDLAAINAHILYKQCMNVNISRRKFILELAKELCANKKMARVAVARKRLLSETPSLPAKRRQCQIRRCSGNKTCEICQTCKRLVCGKCSKSGPKLCMECY